MNDELTPDERASMRARILGGARDIRPAGAHRKAWIAGSIAAVLVVAIAGTVAATSTLSAPDIASTPTPAPTRTLAPSPSPTSTPSATPTPIVVSPVATAPTSRFSFGCDDIVQTVRGIFGDQTPASVLALPQPRGNTWVSGPVQYAFAQAGDLYCEFEGNDGTYATVTLIADGQRALDDRNSFSGGTCDPQYPPCELVAGTFIQVEGSSGTGEPRVIESAAAWDEVRGIVLASPPSPSTWTPPPGMEPLPDDCAELLPADRLAVILGVEEMQVRVEGRGGWSAWHWLMSDYWNSSPCLALNPQGSAYEDPTAMSLVWLPGGQWAFDEDVTGDPVPFDGAKEADRAVLSCAEIEAVEACRTDLLLGGSWIRITLPEIVAPSDRATVASEIASTVAGSVYG